MNMINASEKYGKEDISREIISSRTFNVPVASLFKAWTDPELLAKWWGPKGFTNTFHEFDLKPGGDWKFIMHGPDGKNYDNHSTFIEIVEPELIVFDHVCKPEFRVVATFEDNGEKSSLHWRMIFDSEELCNKVKVYAVTANEENLDRLEDVLKRFNV